MLAEKRKGKRPFLQVTTTVLDETPAEIKKFCRYWKKIVDRADYWYTSLERIEGIERARPLLERQTVKQKLARHEKNTGREWRCNEVMNKMSINWDGTVTACCGDYDNFMKIGDLKENSMKEIWNSGKMNLFREILGKGERNKICFCAKCTSKF